jgi:hypothetical protein
VTGGALLQKPILKHGMVCHIAISVHAVLRTVRVLESTYDGQNSLCEL